MKQDIVIGAIGDYKYDQIKYWVNSLNRSGFTGRKVLLSYNSPIDLLKKLVDNGIEVYEMERDIFASPIQKFESHTGRVNKDTTDILIHHIRFWHAYQLINELGKDKFDWVIFTDVRDVIFQTNPSETLTFFKMGAYDPKDSFYKKKIIASSEYLTFNEEPWNAELGMTNYGPYIFGDILKESIIYNVGSFAAESGTFLELSLMMYLLCYKRNKLSDQPAMSILLNTVFKDKVFLADAESGWSLNFGTMVENYHKFKDKLRGKPPKIKDNIVVTENGKIPICLLHQYERIPEFKLLLESIYE